MSETTDLIIRRAKALFERIDSRTEEHAQAVAAHKKKQGPWVGNGPTLADFYAQLAALRDSIDVHEGEGGHSPIPYVSEVVKSPGGSDTKERHESFGLIGISRTHGGHGAKHLFGSHVQSHPVTMCLRISRAERAFSNDLSYERFHARSLITEIEMSAAQFTGMITNMNMGDGVPCSLRYIDGVSMEPVPTNHKSEQHMILENFQADMRDVRKNAGPLLAKLDAILSKKSIGKKDREVISGLFERLVRKQADNVPFTLGQFGEAVDKLTTEAKREIEAFMSTVVHAAGVDALSTGKVDFAGLLGPAKEASE